MVSIGLVAHRAGTEHFNYELLKTKICDVIDTISYQYSDLALNVDGEVQAGHDIIKHAKKIKIKYNLFLPAPAEVVGKNWFDAQRQQLVKYCGTANSITICSSRISKVSVWQRDKALVDSSSFIICFWEGKMNGRVYSIMKYALATNKFVLSGLDDLKMVTAQMLGL